MYIKMVGLSVDLSLLRRLMLALPYTFAGFIKSREIPGSYYYLPLTSFKVCSLYLPT